MSLDQIRAAIPHREPFLLVDEILSQDDSHIVCRKTFSGDEFWFAGHYPDYPLVPGVLLCEAAMQAGAVLLARRLGDAGDGLPVATRANNVQFREMVRPGDTIRIEVELEEQISQAFYLKARVSVRDVLAVRFNFACTMLPPDRWEQEE